MVRLGVVDLFTLLFKPFLDAFQKLSILGVLRLLQTTAAQNFVNLTVLYELVVVQ